MRRTARRAAAATTTSASATTSDGAASTRAAAAAAAAATVVASSSDSPDAPPAKRAKTATADAWGALFAASKRAAPRAQPRPASPLSAEMQARVDALGAFEGVAARSVPGGARIAAWNVNGLRAVLKKDDSAHLRAYVAQEDPDVLCLSETKIDRDELQKLENIWPQFGFQYWSCASKKGYAGTAVLSKVKPLSVKDEIVVGDKAADDEGRFLALEFDRFWLVHTYVPNAGVKLERLAYRTQQWDAALLQMLQELEKSKPVIWCGDLNVAHEDIDIHDPKTNRNKSPGFTDAERESFGATLARGRLVDSFRALHPDEQQFSYFSYRFNARAKNKGWRIDYFVVSQALMDRVEASMIRSAVTGSDHVPIVLDLKEPL